MEIPKGLGGKKTLMKGPQDIKIRENLVPIYSLRHQPIPVKDFLNFKEMRSGNEVLLNLENHQHFAASELVGGLIELASRAKNMQIDWNEHPITKSALADLK